MIFDLLFKNIIYYLLSIHKKNIFSSVCRAVGILPCAALFIGTLEHKKLHSPKYLQKKIARVKQGQRPAVQCTSRVGKTHSPPPPSPPLPPPGCLSVCTRTYPSTRPRNILHTVPVYVYITRCNTDISG